MPSHPSAARRFLAVVLLIAIVAPAFGSGALPAYARSASTSASFTLDGVGLVVLADALPTPEFTVAEPGAASQLSDTYYFAWYDSVDHSMQISAANVGKTSTTVTIKGIQFDSFTLAPKGTGKLSPRPAESLWGRHCHSCKYGTN